MYILDKLNSVDKDYCVVEYGSKAFQVYNTNNKCYGFIIPNIIGEKGAYIEFDSLITDLSMEELQILTIMVQIVDEYEKRTY